MRLHGLLFDNTGGFGKVAVSDVLPAGTLIRGVWFYPCMGDFATWFDIQVYFTFGLPDVDLGSLLISSSGPGGPSTGPLADLRQLFSGSTLGASLALPGALQVYAGDPSSTSAPNDNRYIPIGVRVERSGSVILAACPFHGNRRDYLAVAFDFDFPLPVEV